MRRGGQWSFRFKRPERSPSKGVQGQWNFERDVNAPGKATFLNALPNAKANLRLFEAEMADKASFDDAFSNVDCVFIACLIPVYKGPTGKPAREMDDEQGYAEIIMPTVNGCLNILKSSARQGVKNVVICSSTSSTNPIPPVPIKNEIDHWSDENEQCRACLLYTSPSPRDATLSRMPSSA